MTEEIDVLIEGSGDDGLMRTAARGAARRVAGNLHVLFEEEMGENCDRAKSHLVVRDRLVEVHRRGAVKTDLMRSRGRPMRRLISHFPLKFTQKNSRSAVLTSGSRFISDMHFFPAAAT